MDPDDFGSISYFGTRGAKKTSEHLVFELDNRGADCSAERGEPGLGHGDGQKERAIAAVHNMTAGD